MSNKMPQNPNKGVIFNREAIAEVYMAAGCFWGAEAFLERIYGVVYTEVGYANGNKTNPSYEDVCSNATNFVEVVYIKYDSSKLSLEELTEAYFKIVNPTSLNKQGGDIGSQYRTGIYPVLESDIAVVTNTIKQFQQLYEKPIVIEVMAIENYYKAEEYHQKYLEKNPGGYCHIDLGILNN